MRTYLSPTAIAAFLPLVACSGPEEEPTEPTAEYACLHVAEGTIVDVAPDRASASTIDVGREPYRVNLVSGVAGYLAFDLTASTDLVLLADWPDAVAAVWTGEDRQAIEGAQPNPFCDEDLPMHYEISLAAGTHHLEIGPIYQGNVWMMVAPR